MAPLTHLDIARNIRLGLEGLVRDALGATCLVRHTLRGAEKRLGAPPFLIDSVPFSNVPTWRAACVAHAQLLMVLLQARHFSRFTAQYLALPLDAEARAAFQSARALARDLLRFVQTARGRLTHHVAMLRDLRAARAELAATTASPRPTLEVGKGWFALVGRPVLGGEDLDDVLSDALVRLTGAPN